MKMLRGVPDNYSATLEKQESNIAPFYVHKAEIFMRAYREAPILLQDMVKASGIRGRFLYHGFRSWRQTTPMAYLKGVWLDRAREELMMACLTAGSGTDIALQVGYSYMSRFSGDYKARFGERPSAAPLCHYIRCRSR